MGSDPFVPAGPRKGRWLIAVGVVVAAVALFVGVVSGVVVVRSVGGPLAESFTSPSRPTPVDEQLSLEAGRYTVFELVGGQSSQGPVTTTRTAAPTLRPDAIEVIGPDGATITAVGFTSGNESLTRGQDVYTGVARFVVVESGPHHLRIDAPAGKQVVIAPSFGSGFGAVLNWMVAGAASVVALVVGAILIIVGAVRGRRPHHRATPAVLPAGQYAGRPFQAPGTSPPAGWYRAPDAADRERYWDGHAWTGHLR